MTDSVHRLLPGARTGSDGRLQIHCNEQVARVATIRRFLTPDECADVIELAGRIEASEGLTGQREDGRRFRDSRVRFVGPGPKSDWIFDRLERALMQVNQMYRFDISGFFEGLQVARYDEEGHYDWHLDIGESRLVSARKLSMSVQLSDPSDYDGGDLEFFPPPRAPGARDQGALIVFPSFLAHRVAPVTRGTRWAMVAWISGSSFR